MAHRVPPHSTAGVGARAYAGLADAPRPRTRLADLYEVIDIASSEGDAATAAAARMGLAEILIDVWRSAAKRQPPTPFIISPMLGFSPAPTEAQIATKFERARDALQALTASSPVPEAARARRRLEVLEFENSPSSGVDRERTRAEFADRADAARDDAALDWHLLLGVAASADGDLIWGETHLTRALELAPAGQRKSILQSWRGIVLRSHRRELEVIELLRSEVERCVSEGDLAHAIAIAGGLLDVEVARGAGIALVRDFTAQWLAAALPPEISRTDVTTLRRRSLLTSAVVDGDTHRWRRHLVEESPDFAARIVALTELAQALLKSDDIDAAFEVVADALAEVRRQDLPVHEVSAVRSPLETIRASVYRIRAIRSAKEDPAWSELLFRLALEQADPRMAAFLLNARAEARYNRAEYESSESDHIAAGEIAKTDQTSYKGVRERAARGILRGLARRKDWVGALAAAESWDAVVRDRSHSDFGLFHEQWAVVLLESGRTEEAVLKRAMVAQWYAERTEPSDWSRRGEVLNWLYRALAVGSEDPRHLPYLEHAWTRARELDLTDPLVTRVAARLAEAKLSTGDAEGSVEVLDDALGRVSSMPPHIDHGYARIQRARGIIELLGIEAGVAAFEEAAAWYDRHGVVGPPNAESVLAEAVDLIGGRAPDIGRGLLERVERLSNQNGEFERGVRASVALAGIDMRFGDTVRSVSHIEAAIETANRIPPGDERSRALLLIAENTMNLMYFDLALEAIAQARLCATDTTLLARADELTARADGMERSLTGEDVPTQGSITTPERLATASVNELLESIAVAVAVGQVDDLIQILTEICGRNIPGIAKHGMLVYSLTLQRFLSLKGPMEGQPQIAVNAADAIDADPPDGVFLRSTLDEQLAHLHNAMWARAMYPGPLEAGHAWNAIRHGFRAATALDAMAVALPDPVLRAEARRRSTLLWNSILGMAYYQGWSRLVADVISHRRSGVVLRDTGESLTPVQKGRTSARLQVPRDAPIELESVRADDPRTLVAAVRAQLGDHAHLPVGPPPLAERPGGTVIGALFADAATRYARYGLATLGRVRVSV